VENIAAKFEAATPEDRESGKLWYPTAREHAVIIGGGDAEKGAGILAALSPRTDWDANLQGAYHIAHTGTAWLAEHDTLKGAGQTSDNNAKALRILNGEHPLKVLGGHKVRSFYNNILNPDDPSHITIDKHAHDIAVGIPQGTRGSGSLGLGAAGRYQHFVHAYRIASGELGVEVPNITQATTWVAHRLGR